MKITYDLTDTPLTRGLIFTGELRPYQVGVVDEILKNRDSGIIKLGTGYGKTIIACEIIRKLNKTALIIVPRVSILNQFKETLKEFYDYEAGIIQGKSWDIKDITIASMATLKKREEQLKDITSKFSIIIADECHSYISEKGIKTIQSFNPRFLLGASATPRRTDEQGGAIFFTFGEILIDRELPQEKPVVHVVKSNVDIEVSIDYSEMIDDMINNAERNNLIFMLAGNELLNKRKILILTKRIAHYEKIKNWFPGKTIVYTISSTTNAKERDKLLTKLRNNEKDFDVIMGTFSMLSTGVDIPKLDTLIVAGDLKSSVLVDQSAGRILRLFNKKNRPKIIDIDDNKNPMLHRQFLERKKFYKSNNWEIL